MSATVQRAPISDEAVSGTWTEAAGSRWQFVDDYPDTAPNYFLVHGTTAGNLTFGFSSFNIPAGSTNISVQVRYYDRDVTSGTNQSAGRLKVGGNYYNASTHNPNTTLTSRSDNWAVNPKTGIAWTVDDINGVGANALQAFGFFSGDANPQLRYSCIQLQVTYTAPPSLIAGVFSGQGSFAGTITDVGGGPSAIQGSFTGSGTITGQIKGRGLLRGGFAGLGSLSGVLRGTGRLGGVFAGESSASGILRGIGAIAGGFTGGCSFSGNLTDSNSPSLIAGSFIGSSSITGIVKGSGCLRGGFSGVCSISGNLSDSAVPQYITYGIPFECKVPSKGYHYLEVYMRAITGTVKANLYDTTADEVIGTVETSSTVFVTVRSNNCEMVKGHEYKVQFGKEPGGNSGEFIGAKIVIKPKSK